MNAKWLRRMAYAVVVCAGSVGTAIAAGPIGVTPAGVAPAEMLNFEQAMEVDAIWVATALDITPEEARSRLNLQEQAGEISERIREQYANRLAGIYIEHEPTSRLVVRLTGPEAERTRFHHFGADTLEVAFVPGADRTLVELQQLLDANLENIKAELPTFQGSYVDERTSEVVIDVLE